MGSGSLFKQEIKILLVHLELFLVEFLILGLVGVPDYDIGG